MIRKFRPINCVIEAVYYDGTEASYKECYDFAQGAITPNHTYRSAIEGFLFPQKFSILPSFCRVGQWFAKEVSGESVRYFIITQREISDQFFDVT
jgi:hypothetical protein